MSGDFQDSSDIWTLGDNPNINFQQKILPKLDFTVKRSAGKIHILQALYTYKIGLSSKSLRPARHIGSKVDRAEWGGQSGEAGHFLAKAWAVVHVGRYMGHFMQQNAFPSGEGKSFQQNTVSLFIAVAGYVFAHCGRYSGHDERVVERDAVRWERIGEVPSVELFEVVLVLLLPLGELGGGGCARLTIFPGGKGGEGGYFGSHVCLPHCGL